MNEIPREFSDKSARETAAFIRSLKGESERAAVVLGVAKLDTLLELLLKRSLTPCAGGRDDLFDTDRPLGTFSAKIAISYRLGLIDKDFEYALQALRRIRNSFAHSIENETLSKASHHDRIFEVKKILSGYEQLGTSGQSLQPVNLKIGKDLNDFCAILMVLIIGLDIAAHISEPVKPSRTFRLRVDEPTRSKTD